MKGGTGAGPPGDRSWRAGLSPKQVRFSREEFPSWVPWAGFPWAGLPWAGLPWAEPSWVFWAELLGADFFPGALLPGDKAG